MQPWPGLLRIKVMLCMAWTGLALTYRYEHVTVQRIQRGRDKEKKINEWACYMHCNRACGCCNLVRRIFPSWRQVPPSDKDKARIKGKGKGHRNRLIGRETRHVEKGKRTLQAALGSISPLGHGSRSDCTGQPETWAIKA
ncbi:hypothetical protein J3E69DRAFT_330501 [Trichoderma sp. SZMC 28015]